jgi:hypothetical protein
MLYNVLPEEQRYFTYINHKICVLQKEYPTAGLLGKPRRQHWDIAVLKSPPEGDTGRARIYDYFKLYAVIEFGLNEPKEYLIDDIERLCHQEANLEHSFIVHLYRLSESGNLTSGRDWSSKSPQIMTAEDIRQLSVGKPVEIYLGLFDSTGMHSNGVRRNRDGVLEEINK